LISSIQLDQQTPAYCNLLWCIVPLDERERKGERRLGFVRGLFRRAVRGLVHKEHAHRRQELLRTEHIHEVAKETARAAVRNAG
jgi:hypothetical protein